MRDVINPCGMVMDYLRTCYKRKVKLFNDSEQLYTIRWYFAPENAKVFPGHHRFASYQYESDKVSPPDGVGEILNPRTFYNGDNPRGYKGQCFVGKQEWFTEGMYLSDLDSPQPAVPPCCRDPIPGVQTLCCPNTIATKLVVKIDTLFPPNGCLNGMEVVLNYNALGDRWESALIPFEETENPCRLRIFVRCTEDVEQETMVWQFDLSILQFPPPEPTECAVFRTQCIINANGQFILGGCGAQTLTCKPFVWLLESVALDLPPGDGVCVPFCQSCDPFPIFNVRIQEL